MFYQQHFIRFICFAWATITALLLTSSVLAASQQKQQLLTTVRTSHPPSFLSLMDFYHDSSTSDEFGVILQSPHSNVSSSFGPPGLKTVESKPNQWNNGVDYFLSSSSTSEDVSILAPHTGQVVYLREEGDITISSAGDFQWSQVSDNSSSFEAFRPNETLLVLKCTLSTEIEDSDFYGATLNTFYVLYSNFSSTNSALDDVFDLGDEVAVATISDDVRNFIHLEVWLQGNCTLADQQVWLKDGVEKDASNSHCFTGYDPAVHPYLFVGNPYRDDDTNVSSEENNNNMTDTHHQLWKIDQYSDNNNSSFNEFAIRYNTTRRFMDVGMINSNIGNFSFTLKMGLLHNSDTNENNYKFIRMMVSRWGENSDDGGDQYSMLELVNRSSAAEQLFIMMISGTSSAAAANWNDPDDTRYWIDINFRNTSAEITWVEVIDIYGNGILWQKSSSAEEGNSSSSSSSSSNDNSGSGSNESSSSSSSSPGNESSNNTSNNSSSSSNSSSGSGSSGANESSSNETNGNSSSAPSSSAPSNETSGSSNSSSSSSSSSSSDSSSSNSDSSSSSNSESSSSSDSSSSSTTNASPQNESMNTSSTTTTTSSSSSTTISTTSPPTTTQEQTQPNGPAPTTPSPFTAPPISDPEAAGVAFGAAALFFTGVVVTVFMFWKRWLRKVHKDEMEGDDTRNPENVQLVSISSSSASGGKKTQIDTSVLDI